MHLKIKLHYNFHIKIMQLMCQTYTEYIILYNLNKTPKRRNKFKSCVYRLQKFEKKSEKNFADPF